jgi:hypothetical protein
MLLYGKRPLGKGEVPMSNIGDYEKTYADFDWETPERFNFGRDVVDRWAAQDRAAMVWLGTSGEERRFDFAQFSVLSSRFAHAARELGISRKASRRSRRCARTRPT